MTACPFCGAENRVKASQFVELKRSGLYGPIEEFCCRAQETNSSYKKKFRHGEEPDDKTVEQY